MFFHGNLPAKECTLFSRKSWGNHNIPPNPTCAANFQLFSSNAAIDCTCHDHSIGFYIFTSHFACFTNNNKSVN